jgi:hypothetical protein
MILYLWRQIWIWNGNLLWMRRVVRVPEIHRTITTDVYC